jgi:hypothetical protein
MLIETGRAEPHRFGVTGWVSHELDDDVIELFRLGYERARVAEARRNLVQDVTQVAESGE